MLSFLNPVSHITDRDGSLMSLGRRLRLTRNQKIIDFFCALTGNNLIISSERGLSPFNERKFRLGILDYLTGGTLLLVEAIGALLVTLGTLFIAMVCEFDHFFNYRKPPLLLKIALSPLIILGGALFIAGALLVIPAILVKSIIAAIATLIAYPAIRARHEETAQQGQALRDIIKNECQKTTSTLPINHIINRENKSLSPIPVDELFAHGNNDAYAINKIESYTHNHKKFKLVFVYNQNRYEHGYILFSDTPEGETAFKAFIQLNMFNYADFATKNPIKNSCAINYFLAQATQSYTPATSDILHKPGANPFHTLPLEVITKIAMDTTVDFTNSEKEKATSTIARLSLFTEEGKTFKLKLNGNYSEELSRLMNIDFS